MNVAAIVIASIFGGALFIVILAGMAALIFLHLRAAKERAELTKTLTAFQEKMESITGQAKADLTGIVESAKSSFSGIRVEIKTSQELQAKALGKSLKEFEAAFRETIGKINGDMLLKSSMQALQATREISALCVTLKSLLVDHEAPAATSELGPEEYGPSDTIYSQVSPAARMDAALEQQEAADAAPLFSTAEV